MSRFEQEISSVATAATAAPVSFARHHLHSTYKPPTQPPTHSMQFIPHQLQRHQTTMTPRSVAPMMGYSAPSYPVAVPSATALHQPPPPPPPPPMTAPSSSTIAPLPASHPTSNYPSSTGYTVTPMGLPSQIHTVPSTMPPGASSANGSEPSGKKKSSKSNEKGKKQKKFLRLAGGQTWEDQSLQEWETDDFRIFCGDLGNDVNNEILSRAFSKYPSFLKSKVVRDKRTNKTKGYGFVSFKDPNDFIRAMREMNGKYVGSRPIKLRKSCWRDRSLDQVKKKTKERQKLGLL